jgi:hypothetical protein
MWITAIVMALSACSSMTVDSDFNRETNFADYKTFAFISDQPLLLAGNVPISPLFEGRAMNAAKEALTSNGFEFVTDRENADFVLSFTLGARDKIRVTNYPPSYRHPAHRGWGAPYYSDVDVRNYTEGTLAIDIFDVQSHSPVWHGWAVKTISDSDRRNPTPAINEVVSAILAKFPPN